MKYLTTFLLILTSHLLFADGPPIDSDGNITAKYFTVELTDNQKTKLEHSRKISLTKEQMEIVKHVWPFEEIEILDPHHRDCTCGMYYAIWVNPKEIAFLGDENASKEIDLEVFEEQYEMQDDSYIEDRSRNIYIGTNGDIYYNDKITDTEALKKILQSFLKEKDKQYAIIYVAPRQGNTDWEKVEAAKEQINSVVPEKIYAAWM